MLTIRCIQNFRYFSICLNLMTLRYEGVIVERYFMLKKGSAIKA